MENAIYSGVVQSAVYNAQIDLAVALHFIAGNIGSANLVMRAVRALPRGRAALILVL